MPPASFRKRNGSKRPLSMPDRHYKPWIAMAYTQLIEYTVFNKD